ncbi:hypothetical protein BASA84_000498 [Batrachochytrium salamandrivorans]|nr:hypothetical protein BASA84_000498 [Batrachochytrium salamandrivorans]
MQAPSDIHQEASASTSAIPPILAIPTTASSFPATTEVVSPTTSATPIADATRRGRTLLYIAVGIGIWYLFGFATNSTNQLLEASQPIEAMERESASLQSMSYELNATRYSHVLDSLINTLVNVGPSPVFYSNISGQFKGVWEQLVLPQNVSDMMDPSSITTTPIRSSSSPLSVASTSASDVLATDPRGSMNLISGGSLELSIIETTTSTDSIAYINGRMRITDGQHSFDSIVHGLHFIQNGTAVLESATAEGDLFLHHIPRMMPNRQLFEKALSVVKNINNKNLEDLKRQLSDGKAIENEQSPPPPPKVLCRFSIFIQLQPLPVSKIDIMNLEKELDLNEGVTVISPPEMTAKMLLWSPNCEASLQVPQLHGTKRNIIMNLTHNAGVFVIVLTLIELFLTTRQMQQWPTLSAQSKISPVTMSMMIILDAYMCIALLSAGLVLSNLFIPLATGAFVKFCMFSVFEMRYLFIVIQARRRDGSNFLERSFLFRVYFYASIGGFFLYQLTSRVSAVATLALFLMYSFWIPQIFSNINRNSRHAFNRSYVVGTSLTRLLLPVYAWYYQGDIIALHEPPTTGQLVAFVIFISIQISILIVQDIFGPRIFVPQRLIPQSYNYHPVSPSLSDDGFISLQLGSATDAASHTTRAVDPSSASSTSISSPVLRRSHSTSFTTPSLVSEALPGRNQCAICFTDIRILARHHPLFHAERFNHMVTPCQHFFHTECLERWMDVKLECPVCRFQLPPIY